MDITPTIISFERDDGNRAKNWTKHRVSWSECENAFFNDPLFILPDPKHSDKEERFHALGHTNNNRLLFISFTIRKERIRVISAREMSRRERRIYNEQKEKHSKV
jgi:uncharacterized DUF497 family protein